MSNTEQAEELMSLARRALSHEQNKTTDSAEAVMRMPIEAYTDENRYRAERDRIFKTLPQALALSIELPNPGDFKTISAMETPVLMVRGDDNIVRAFLNVCRHRGARVCEETSGNSNSFPCPYHAWTYNRQGDLIARYGAKVFGDVPEDELGLAQLYCQERAGILWVTLDGSEFDASDWLGDFAEELETLDLDKWHLFDKRELIGPGWKVTMDGYLEIYHHNMVHGATVGQHTIGNLLVLDTYGPHQRMTLARKTLGQLADQPESEWEPLEHMRLVHSCFPNLSISSILGDHCLVSQIFPGETPDQTVTVQMILAAKKPETDEELAATKLFSDMVLQAVQDEDYRLGLNIQAGLKSGANTEFLYGKNEPAVQNYHNWISRFMSQRAEINWSQ
jgi:phenylpropionate dioxygenase-like ring-hydroxylating dioxygenase large terminal subunit